MSETCKVIRVIMSLYRPHGPRTFGAAVEEYLTMTAVAASRQAAQEEREDRATKKVRSEEKMARQEELAAREEAVKVAASRLKRRQRFLEMSPRDQGWWSLSKVKAGEKCGVCEACWTAGEENEEEQEGSQCLGLTHKPTAPTSPIMCMTCEGHISLVSDHAHYIPGKILPHFDPSHLSVAQRDQK